MPSQYYKIVNCNEFGSMSSHTEGMLKEITSLANDCLENSNNQLQSCVIIMILKIAIVDTWPESTPLPLFRTTFLFFLFWLFVMIHMFRMRLFVCYRNVFWSWSYNKIYADLAQTGHSESKTKYTKNLETVPQGIFLFITYRQQGEIKPK